MGVWIWIIGVIGVYGGEFLVVMYFNGDQVGYVMIVYECELFSEVMLDFDEIIEFGWFLCEVIVVLLWCDWIDCVIQDVLGDVGC